MDGKALAQLGAMPDEMREAIANREKSFHEVRRDLKRAEVIETAALPSSTYRVLYADPPWTYGDQLTEDYGPTKFHYPAMSITDLCALPIKALAQDDAVLFLWVTFPCCMKQRQRNLPPSSTGLPGPSLAAFVLAIITRFG